MLPVRPSRMTNSRRTTMAQRGPPAQGTILPGAGITTTTVARSASLPAGRTDRRSRSERRPSQTPPLPPPTTTAPRCQRWRRITPRSAARTTTMAARSARSPTEAAGGTSTRTGTRTVTPRTIDPRRTRRDVTTKAGGTHPPAFSLVRGVAPPIAQWINSTPRAAPGKPGVAVVGPVKNAFRQTPSMSLPPVHPVSWKPAKPMM